MWIELFKRYPRSAAIAERGVEAAAAAGDWQAAYDAALRLDIETPGNVVRLLHVASGVKQAGAPDAALDILERVVDAPDMPEAGYWLLVTTLTEVGRFDDAAATVELMQARGSALESQKAA